MPIYAYKCSSCGHSQDVLQKLSDVPLTDCPACGQASYSKQVTAPQFQLKGSGWYVTDFRGGNSATKDDKSESAKADAKSDAKPGAATETKSDTKTESAPACPVHSAPTPAAAPTPAPAKSATAKE